MSFGPTNYRRGGTRGGADQFKWDDVKVDKYRENYLGHSVCAPVGRWQKGKDLLWYSRDKASSAAAPTPSSASTNRAAELALVRQQEEQMMNEALGLAPRQSSMPTDTSNTLDAAEMKELLRRGSTERDHLDIERVEGLGAAPTRRAAEHIPKMTKADKARAKMERGDDPFADDSDDGLAGSSSAFQVAGSRRPRSDSSGSERGSKRDKRAKKERKDRKERKNKAKKEKKHKKEKKRQSRKEDKKERKRRRRDE